MRNAQSGFSLLEVMAAVATVGVLSAVVIPSFLKSKPKAQTADAQAELVKIEAAARNYYLAEGKFPGSTVTSLPGPNGAACSNTGKKFPVTSLWASDPVWKELDFHVDQASSWTYYFETTGTTTARIRAVGDPNCEGHLTSIQVDMTADVAMDEENDGSDESGQVAHNWAPQTAQEAGVYPGSSSTVSSPGGTPSGGVTNLGATSSSSSGSGSPGAPSAGTVATAANTNTNTTTNTISSSTTVSGACNWGNGNGQGQGCINGVANGDTNNTNNDHGHSNVTTTTTTTTTSTTTNGTTTSSTSGTTTSTSTGTVAGGTVNTSNGNGNGNNGNGNGNGNGKK